MLVLSLLDGPAGGSTYPPVLSPVFYVVATELQTYCVDAINVYRTTNPNFSNGQHRNLPQNLYSMKNPDTSFLQCMNEKALSDLKYAKSEVCFSSACGCKNKWENYATWLEPLKEALGDSVE